MPRHVSSPSMGLAPWVNQMCIRVSSGSLTSAVVCEREGGEDRCGERSNL